VAGNVDNRCPRLGAGRGLHRLSSPRIAMAGRPPILPILGAAMIVGARQGTGGGGLLGMSSIQRLGDWSYQFTFGTGRSGSSH
jgi:hypothetical protein